MRLNTNSYLDDSILKLCDVGNKQLFAHHMMCASLYEKKIRVLIGQEDNDDNGALPRLISHLDALKLVARYREAFGSSATDMISLNIASFFS